MKTCICNKCGKEIEINVQEEIIDPNAENKVVDQFFIFIPAGDVGGNQQ